MTDDGSKQPLDAPFNGSSEDVCSNCSEPLHGFFCSACGQRNEPLRKPIWLFLKEAFKEFFGVDGRLWVSLKILLLKPGRLTTAYLQGQRVRYIRPLRMYLIASILFFFLLSMIDPVRQVDFGDDLATADSTITVGEYLETLDSKKEHNENLIAEQITFLDSLKTKYQTDSLAFNVRQLETEADSAAQEELALLEERLENLADKVEEEKGDLRSIRNRVRERNRQLNWVAEQIASSAKDSLIYPADVEQAAELLFDEAPADNMEIGFPDWWPQSEALQRLRYARTDQEAQGAVLVFLADTLRQLPTVMFAILPIFAFLLKVLYLRREWYYSEHLVFGLHTHGFAFLIFTVMLILYWLDEGFTWISIGASVLSLVIPVYFYIAQKYVYGQGWLKTAFKATMLGTVYMLVLTMGLVLALLLAASL